MSILTETIQARPTDGQLLAQRTKQLKIDIARSGEQMFNSWSNSFDQLWKKDKFTPAQKLAALGTEAAEVFVLSASIVQFMMTIFDGRRPDLIAKINAKMATLPEFTINQDGSVSLVEPTP